MSVSRFCRSVLTVAALCGAACAQAAGWGAILKDGPVLDFTDEDKRLYDEAVTALLNAPSPVQPTEWSNPATGAGGSLRVLAEPKRDGYAQCRQVQSKLKSKRQTGYPSTWTACRDAAGQWKLVAAS